MPVHYETLYVSSAKEKHQSLSHALETCLQACWVCKITSSIYARGDVRLSVLVKSRALLCSRSIAASAMATEDTQARIKASAVAAERATCCLCILQCTFTTESHCASLLVNQVLYQRQGGLGVAVLNR